MTIPAPDEKLRDLERRWRQSGSPDDEAALLLERVRVGDLTQDRLDLAAYCGHEGARRALPAATEDAPATPIAFQTALARWGFEACLTSGIAAVRSRLPEREARDPDPRPRQGVDATERWLHCPCAEHAELVRQAYADAWSAFQGGPYFGLVARAASLLASTPQRRDLSDAGGMHPNIPALQAVKFVDRAPAHGPRIVQAMREALVTWALGPGAVTSSRHLVPSSPFPLVPSRGAVP